MRRAEPSSEVEAKLALPGPTYWLLRDDPGRLGLPFVRQEYQLQTNLYYDTPSGKLRRAGASLRARRIAGRPGVEWTLKSARRVEGSVQSTEELVAIGPDGADPLTLASELEPVVATRSICAEPLRVEMASTNERVALTAPAPSGGEVEVALDRLRIPDDPVFVDYELEAEAHGAPRGDVARLADDLSARFRLKPSRGTKRARLRAYARGRLGPPRASARDVVPRLAKIARVRTDAPSCVRLIGLTGSPLPELAATIEHELGIAITVETDEPAAEPRRPAVTVFVGSSVHWRLLRHLLATPAEAFGSLRDFSRRVAVDRREREWLWRSADLVVNADVPLVAVASASPAASRYAFLPDDVPPRVGAEVWLESVGGKSTLCLGARAWPVGLADHALSTFDLGQAGDQARELLLEIGYQGRG